MYHLLKEQKNRNFTSYEFHMNLRIHKGPSSLVKQHWTTALLPEEVCFTLESNWICKRYLTEIHASDIKYSV
jgi:hypothetical protein